MRSKSSNHYGSLFFADYPRTPPRATQLGAISPLRICISEVMRLGGRPSTTSIKIHVGGCSESWRRVGWGEMIYERGEYGVISVPTL